MAEQGNVVTTTAENIEPFFMHGQVEVASFTTDAASIEKSAEYAEWSRKRLKDEIRAVKAKIARLEYEVSSKTLRRWEKKKRRLEAGIKQTKAEIKMLQRQVAAERRKKHRHLSRQTTYGSVFGSRSPEREESKAAAGAEDDTFTNAQKEHYGRDSGVSEFGIPFHISQKKSQEKDDEAMQETDMYEE